MNLVFVSREQYPDGGAPANRHIAYAKGLIELGHKVAFILFSGQNTNETQFTHEGVSFICAETGRLVTRGGIIKKISSQVYLIAGVIKTINAISKAKGIDAMVLLTTWNQDLFPLIGMAKFNKIKVLHERTEYPFIDSRAGLRGKIDLFVYLYYLVKKFDGLYVINNTLVEYFNRFLKGAVPIKVVNMVVDLERFESGAQEGNCVHKYIAYCGVLNSNKDGVDILVESFIATSKIGRIPNDISLLLIGEFDNSLFKARIDNIILDAGIKDKIIFTGRLERTEIPRYLNNAAALALARPSNKQAEGGFPTKLGEYLATGKPTIITNTGEISIFLKDGFNAFIAEPGSIDSFADKIDEVFSNYPRALEVGMRGRTLVENEFNYLKQSEKLAQFIQSLT